MKASWAGPIAICFVGVALSAPALGQDNGTDRRIKREPGTVYTFYGLRKLEDDPAVSDAEKLREWQAFIDRARKQLAYAERAVGRWKNAARARVLDEARQADQDEDLSPRDKIERWSQVARLYPKSREAWTARRRTTHWTKEETKRRVSEAERVEKAAGPKVDRINAWASVLSWAKKGPEARAAQRRIQALQKQLYAEALSVDRIARVDKQTKLAAWRDVLAGRPTRAQRAAAERRVKALQTEIGAN